MLTLTSKAGVSTKWLRAKCPGLFFFEAASWYERVKQTQGTASKSNPPLTGGLPPERPPQKRKL